MVNLYTYLGVVFITSVMGIPTVNYAVNKSKITTETALSVLAKLKAVSWSGKITVSNLPKCTSDYSLCIEMNILHIAIDILQLAINWGINTLKLESHRLPKLCLFRLVELRNSFTNQHKCNRAQQLSNLLRTVIDEPMLDNMDTDYWSARKNIILSKCQRHLALADREKDSRSSNFQAILPIPLFEVISELILRVPHHLSKQ